MQVISREAAKAAGLKFFFTGQPCRNGHIAQRYIGYAGTCIECSRARDAQRRQETQESRDFRRKYDPKIQARELARKAGLLEYSTGVPCRKGHDSRYVSDGKCVGCYSEKKKRWKSNNTGKVAASRREREFRKIKATPPWLTKEHREQIEAIYLRAQIMSDVTGVPYHVDHIIPIKGENVCGLHVPWNLQVITAEENLRKSNKVEGL